MCITGLTTFCLTYCKNGGDAPDYTIKVSRGFGSSSDIQVRGDGTCPKQLSVSGLNESSIVWNSIYPGLPGAYNSYLNTTVASDTVIVNPTTIPPGGYIDYQVCGQAVGCSTANLCDTVRVYVYSSLALSLSPANPVICTGSAGTGSVTLTATLTGGKLPYTYSWTGPGGFTSSLQSPTVSSVGTYTATVNDSLGCAYLTDTILVTSNLIPDVNSSGTGTVCSGRPLNYSIISTVSGATYTWSRAAVTGISNAPVSGQTSSTITETLINTTTSPINVTYLIVPSNGVCAGGVFTYVVTVYPKPTASFTVNNANQCLSSNSLAFNSSSSLADSYSWTFGDGGTSLLQNPTHSYTAAGTYQVKLVVTTNNGCKDSTAQVITINPQPSAVTYTINAGSQCLTGNSFAFATAATVSGGTVGYAWNFGDGGTSTTQNPTHGYTTAGTYQVGLVVTTNNGCKDSTAQTVTVYPQPVAAFTTNSSSQCLSNNTISFTNTSTVSSGSITGYSWTFGDGGSSLLQNPTHSYATAGTYQVKLVVTTNNGCKDSTTQAITINPQPTAVTYTINAGNQCLTGNIFAFVTSATVAGGTVGYAWNFGDGGTSTTQNPTHGFAAAGTYQVSLVVTTNNGCKDSTAQTVIVYPQPVAGFTTNNNPQCLSNNNFPFTSTSTVSSGSITGYSWTFGDGGTSTAQNPAHNYTSAGTYQVKLVVSTNTGCKDSTTQAITINPQPTAVTYTINAGNQCLTGNNFAFATGATVSGGTVGYAWNFGDGGTSSLQNPAHNYTSAGTYQVKLVVTTNNGCKDSTTQSITINPQPIAVTYTINAGNQCLTGNSFAFATSATVAGGTVGYAWNFGDGGTSTTQNPTHSYTAAGPYQVQLMVTSNNGCKDSTAQTIIVYPQPIAAFTTSNSTQCLSNNNFNFTSTSTVSSGSITGYSWTFGDGGTSTAQNPIHSYTTAGTYQIKLVVTTNNGCKDSISNSITIHPQPVAAFTINNTSQCLSNNNAGFTNASTISSGSITNYSWNFGDGGTSTTQNPTHSYASAGAYQVSLVATTNNGCKDSTIQTVTIYPQPTSVSYTVNAGNQCLTGNNFVFTTNATVSAGTVSYAWNFGDGGTATLQNPTHGYTTAGTYQVGLIVTTNNGCKDSATQQITVYPQPVAAFTTNNNPQCLSNNNFSFTNTSTVSSGTIASYSWNFGDGGTSTAQHPVHSYASAGSYQVKLVVTTNNGCKDSTIQTVTINLQPTGVNYTVNTNSQCLSGNNFVFTTNATVSGGTVSYTWNFGDGGTSTAQNPIHSYAVAGTYQVGLVVITNNGCKDSVTQTITVYAQPIAGYTVNTIQQCFSNNIFLFTNTSTISSGSIVQYNWNFGNGATSSVQNPTYSYTIPGTYQVKLVVTSNNGCKDSLTQIILVNPQPVGINFTINNSSQCFSGNSFSFNATASVSSGNITSYNWNFGDGTTATGATATHSYTAAGTYQVKLVVTTDQGCKDSIVQNVTGFPQPIAGFTINNNQQCLNNNSLAFANTSTVNTGTIATYHWNFGDGQTSTQQNPTHVYTTAGSYQIKLVITTDNGCKDSISQTVTVYPQPTATNFAVNAGNQCLSGNSFAFTTNATVTSGTVTYNWNFGDGQTSVLQNPTHIYAAAGAYLATLVVTTDNGCKDSASNNLTVYPQPTGVSFTINSTSPCVSGNSFAFNTNATVTSGTVTYSWDFGDGSTSTLQSPTHTYAVGGTYPIKLVVTTNNGCKDSIVQNVTLHAQPTGVDFSVNANAQCLSSNSFGFATNATVSTGSITYNWTFGDGGTSALQNPTHAYAAAGTYLVKLVIATDYGCNDSATHSITVYPQPAAGFTINNSQQCFSNNGFAFTNTSTVSSGNIANYSWSFGDGQTSTVQNPTHSYTITGSYTIKLVVTTNQGCKDSITQNVTVYQQPSGMDFTINAGNQCLSGNSFAFTTNAAVTSGTVTYQWNFGDGQTSIAQNPTHAYAATGTYQVKLVVTTNNGCADSVIKSVTVYAQPSGVDFTFNSGTQCLSSNSFSFNTNASVSTGSIAYSWDFGDGQTSTLQNPTHAYVTAGTYPVKLVVTTNQGCKDSIVKNAIVYPPPTGVTFVINTNNQCLSGNNYAFSTNATVAAGTVSYSWSFGDGGTSALQNPTHSYTATGTYLVKLVITTNNGCKDSATQTVIVYPQPLAGFITNNNTQCFSSNNFIFTNSSTVSSGNITGYSWNFGDGGTSATQNPTHTYTTGGTYYVGLVVTTNNGCRDSITQTVTVYPQPVAGFAINNNPQCLSNNNFGFTNTSSVNSGSIVNYDWSFGDGGTSTVQNPAHNYAVAGTYQVKLVVTTNNGCKDSTTQTVTVYSQPTSVSYTVNVGSQCLSSNSFAFATNASVGGGTVTYTWNFGDGGISSLQNPTHTYTIAGTYQIGLVVTTNNGCKDSASQTVTVYPQPIAGFTTNNNPQCLSNNNFLFINTSTVSSGTISYAWAFGDGSTSTAQDPAHAYTTAGTYQVKLVVTTNNGCKDSTMQTITVNPQPTGLNFAINNGNQCLSNNSFTFTTNATVTGGTVTYSWNFGDGGTSSLQNTAHSYISAGTYQVKLVVTTNNGCKDSITQTVTVYPQPVAGFTSNTPQCLSNNSFSFTSTSTVSSGGIAGYSWNFGDGGTSTAQNPTHNYAAAGAYQVKLVVTTNNGCKDSSIQTVTVYPQAVAGFTTNNNPQCLSSNNFVFTNTSTVSSGTITSYSWSFGDGGTATIQGPTHSYAAAGAYQVKLVVTTNNGCMDSTTQTIIINPQPTGVTYTINSSNQCLNGNSFTFTTNASVASGTVSYAWNFGDGATASLQNPTHSYAAAGTYQVKLVITTNNGCMDSITQTATVYLQPVAGFTTNNNAQCLSNNHFAFTNTSTVSSGSISYSWTFGDGGTSTVQNPTHNYAAAGTYQVSLVATTNNGCKDSITQAVTVYPQPTSVSYTINTGNQCLSGNNFAFATNATVSGGTVSYAWNFGDGAISSLQNPTHSYTAAGAYQVTLVATTNNGCTDSVSQTVTVYPQPVAGFTTNNNPQCLSSNNFTFTNTSTVSSGNITNYSWSFGDGGASAAQNPTHSYAAAGTYQVKLVVTTNNGCKDSVTGTVTVSPQPLVSFTTNNSTQCLSNNNFTFTSTSTVSNGSITNYSWSFGDGGTSAAQNPTHSYAAAGTYQVKLVVTTNNGCKDSTAQTFTVYAQPTSVNYTVNSNSQCLSGNSFVFAGNASVSVGTVSYTWNFGDGGISALQNPTHSYTVAGTYQVSLVATTNNGCKDSIVQNITVNPQPISVAYTINAGNQCLSNNSFAFATNATVGGGTVTYAWNFGDGGTSAAQNPTHSYTLAGTFQVTLLVTTNNGCKDSTTQTVIAYPPPVAGFTTNNNPQCLSNNIFAFTNTSTISSGTISYAWNFGDGGTSTAQNPTHSYPAAGIYQVTLVVTSNNGCKDSTTQTITINPQPAGVSYTINNGTQCLSANSFAFTANATVGGGTVSYAWNFGDGGNSSLQNPTHSYAAAGTYQVKLVVTTNNGCKDSTAQTVTIKPDAIAEINFNNQQGCAPYTIAPANIQLINHPTENISYEWYVNGLLIGTSITFPGYTITNDGDTARITLKAISRFGCFNDTASVKFWTVGKPHPNLALSDTVGCGPLSINILNTTPSSGLFLYQWSFGQGQTSTNTQPGTIVFPPSPNHIDTIYTIALTASSVCDTISFIKNVLVRTTPKAAFTASNLTGCSPITVTFTNTSFGSNIQSYTWLFGDGTTLTAMATTVSHTYTVTTNTTFNVQLIATNICGNDTATVPIVVKPDPINLNIQILNNQTSGCAPLTINLSNASAGATSYHWDFGDGNTSNTTTNGIITHTYATAGNYTVTIAATDNCAYDTMRIPVYALPLPNINFTVPTNPVCIGDPVLYNNLSEIGLSYLWDFGDGYSSTLYSPTHSYTAAGTYTITLSVTRPAPSGNGCTVSLTKQLIIVSQLPGAFTLTDTAGKCLPFTVSFANQSLPSAQTTWNFGDGNTGTGNNTSHTYTQNGNYLVSMQSISPGGCTYTASKNISVTAPVGNFTYSSGYQCANTPISFQSQAQYASSYVWDFGDGTTITTTSSPISHTYTTAGTYHPTITLKNNDGCVVLIPGIDSIKIDKVVASFTAQPLQTCLGSSTNFTNSSTAYFGMQQWEWNFGDGGTSSTQHPSHPYSSTGTFPVQLITTGISGCKDTTTQPLNIQVYQVPIASINSVNDACINSSVSFNSAVVGNDPIASYNWTFSNGSSFTTANVAASFSQAGAVNATVIIKTIYGCADTATKSITIRPLPNVNAGNDGMVCWGSSRQLNAVGAATYQWAQSSSLSCTNCQSPIATPTSSTYYNVVGTSTYGCVANDSVYVSVIDTFALTANNAVMCNGDKTSLLATGAATYQWTPSSTLSAANIANPMASPTGTTTYTVTGKDSHGCFTRTADVTVTVNPLSTLYIGKDTVTTTESSYQFVTTVGVSPAVTWSWAPATALSCTNCPNPFIAEVKKDITYIATITNQWGCRTRDTLRIMAFCPDAQIFIPNILTPDGDGYNDMMIVRAKGIKKVNSVKVFNRWGELVFAKNDFIPNDKTYGWDGTYKGKLVDPDVFVYVCEVICESNRIAFYKGNITVIR